MRLFLTGLSSASLLKLPSFRDRGDPEKLSTTEEDGEAGDAVASAMASEGEGGWS